MKRVGLVLLLALTAMLLMSSAALAATPQEIFDDYAVDGRLDGDYTDAELQAYLDDAPGDVYGAADVKADLDVIVRGLLAEGDDDQDTFPFTGMEIALIFLGGLGLIGSGVVIRKWAR